MVCTGCSHTIIWFQASILFNIGSIWSQIGAKQVRNKLWSVNNTYIIFILNIIYLYSVSSFGGLNKSIKTDINYHDLHFSL